MGKVVRTVAILAVAVAVAAYAPQLSAALVHAGLSAAAAAAITAVAAAVVTTIGGAIVNAVLPAPRASVVPHTRAEMRRAPTFGFDGLSLRRSPLSVREFADPDCLKAAAIQPPWWRDLYFLPWQRVSVVRSYGDCMAPTIPAGKQWLVVDRLSEIKAGDIIVLSTDDLKSYNRGRHDWPPLGGLVKRFHGIDTARGEMVFECTNPAQRLSTPLSRITCAYRVVSWHRTWLSAMRAKT